MRTVVCNFKDEIAFLSSFPSAFQGHREREVSPQPRPSPGSVRTHYPPSQGAVPLEGLCLIFPLKRGCEVPAHSHIVGLAEVLRTVN